MQDQDQRYALLGSLLLFTRFFFKLRTNREFHIQEPVAREPRQITICRELTNVLLGETANLLINIHPGSSKSELCIHFVAWALARYPDCNFLYISYSKELAEKHTHTIKRILELPAYQQLFNVQIRNDSAAKGKFTTTAGGSVMAFGSGGSVTGQDAGIPNLDRFSGALILDDVHKPDEVHSDTIREKVISNYFETLMPRLRSPTIPTIAIGQRLHEADLFAEIIEGKDGKTWNKVILKMLDEIGHNLSPDILSEDQLRNMQKTSRYVFASQYQQDPIPAGGSVFRINDFPKLVDEPDIFYTFMTVDTAETDKTYNDATAFSFWGLYYIKDYDIESKVMGLHWIDCAEIWVEPKDLQSAFIQFYATSMRHRVQPDLVMIEKKSTGVTLSSILSDLRGLTVRQIDRNRRSGSKATRYMGIQSIIAAKRVSLPAYAKHTQRVIDHMSKITLNDTHRYDDIADTCVDAVIAGLIDRTVGTNYTQDQHDENLDKFANEYSKVMNTRLNQWRM
jgi:hypothetical protein